MENSLKKKKTLGYSINKVSSTSVTSINYAAENILEDKPNDPSSRWSSDTNAPPQFLILKLHKTAIVTSITFGKFEKNHVCNLKRFKVFGGCEEENMIELLDGGLKNDTVKETFHLRHCLNGRLFPCNYIKIVPILSWGPSFNFSIWHVALAGDDSQEAVQPAIAWHNEFREKEAIRLCLKHFRQQNLADVFECLQKRTRVQLEHPMLTRLYESLVRNGNYDKTETLIQEAINEGLFDGWIKRQTPTPTWTVLIAPDESCQSDPDWGSSPSGSQLQSASSQAATPNEEQSAEVPSSSEESHQTSPNSASAQQTSPAPIFPGCRGGHQMVLESSSQTIYLFGGWDGNQDLGDFWSYHIPTGKWTLISSNTEKDGGPSPRSCHKMVLDTEYRHLFVLGRYVDRNIRDDLGTVKSDFYVYDLNSSKWTLITDDTASMGGPNLIFDHQMCIDQSTRTLYVFGGQTLSKPSEERIGNLDKRYSGLFEYQIPNNTWKRRRDEEGSSAELRSRSSHSMLFHQGTRKLYVFGGQRKRCGQRDEYLNDFFSYSVDNDDVEIISTGLVENCNIPAVGHTQRATIDCERNEVHVMTGLNKDKDREKGEKLPTVSKISNSFWVYDILHDKWSCLYRNDQCDPEYWNRMQRLEPRPRYAHQLVYDEANKVHYMFGGNPGGRQGKEEKLRLGDFWKFELIRLSRDTVLRKAKLLVRKAKFFELSITDKLSSLHYLQTALSEVVDHNDKDEEEEFRTLASKIFQVDSGDSRYAGLSQEANPVHYLRNELFENLSLFFPSDMTHPRNNLVDLVSFPMDID